MILYGANGHAKVIVNILEELEINISRIIDDNDTINSLHKYSVNRFSEVKITEDIIIAIGNNEVRKIISEKLNGSNFGKAIHPSAIIDNSVSINNGSVVMANAVINASATIGKHCIINTNAVIEHDNVINDFVHVSPSATLCGNVRVGEGTHVGAGVTVIPNITIGKWCVIGAGTVIIRDIPDNSVVYGNPGKIIRQNR